MKIGQRRKFWIDLENRAAIEFHSKDYSSQAAGVVGLASAGRLMEHSDNERTKTAGGLMQAAAGIGAIFLVFSIAKEMQTRSRFVADAFGVKIPKTSKVLTFVALLPIVALLAVTVRHRFFQTIITVLLVGYYLLQLFGNGFEKSAENIVSIVDYAVLGKSHMYLGGTQFVDPEGVLSTFPAVAQVMIGFLCGKIIAEEKEIRSQIVKLAVWGTAMLVVGYLWSYGAPLNKRLWSSSFVLVTCGATSLILATLVYLIDDLKKSRWAFPFLVVGVNPLSIYILSEVLGELFSKLEWTTFSFDGLWQPLFGNYGGSLAYALAFLLLNWLVAWFLYKKHIYIKL